nr:hypothetical protein [Tanacetum cinerariifolium]
ELVDVVKKTLEFGAQGVEYGKETRIDMIEKSKEELEMFEALENKSVVVESGKHRVVVFTKALPWAGLEDIDEVGRASSKLVKMGKATRNKSLNVNKLTPPTLLKTEEIPLISSYALPPVYHPLSPKQKDKILKALDRKYKELEEQQPIVEVIENYMTYRKKMDEKMCYPRNFVLPVRVNETTQISTLADTGASASVLPYTLYKNLSLGDPSFYYSPLTMADNTQAKAMDEVRNVRIQIGYQVYLVDVLVLDIPVDKELPLLLGRLLLRTCGVIIDMGHVTMTTDDGVIRHTYFPKPRAKAYLENFEVDEDEDWLNCFEVGRDEDGNPKYGPVAPSFLEIEDDMERALAM